MTSTNEQSFRTMRQTAAFLRAIIATLISACLLLPAAALADTDTADAAQQAAQGQTPAAESAVQPGNAESIADTGDVQPKAAVCSTANRPGAWSYKKVKKSGKRVRVKSGYRFSDGTCPTRIAKIGSKTYYFKDERGTLGTAKSKRVVTLEGKTYCVRADGQLGKGWQVVAGKLYRFSGAYQCALTNATSEGIALKADGSAKRTLDAALKIECLKVLDKTSKRASSKKKRLKAAWRYLTSSSHYSYRAISVSTSSSTWAKRLAYELFKKKSGNCYAFAAAFCALADELGFKDVRIVAGRVPGSRDGAGDGYTRHAACKIGGKWYDPEAQFAGWHSGIYALSHMPVSFISRKSCAFDRFDGSGAARYYSTGTTTVVSGKLRLTHRKSTYTGKTASGKKLRGAYLIKGRLCKFDAKGHMSDKLAARLKAASKKGRAWVDLRKLLGKPKKTQRAASCLAAGTDVLYTYAHVKVSTFIASGTLDETVQSVERS